MRVRVNLQGVGSRVQGLGLGQGWGFGGVRLEEPKGMHNLVILRGLMGSDVTRYRLIRLGFRVWGMALSNSKPWEQWYYSRLSMHEF